MNREEHEEQFGGIWVPRTIWDGALNGQISFKELLVLMLVHSFVGKGGDCFASNRYIGEKLRVSETRARHIIAGLVEKGFLIRTDFDGRKRFLTTCFSNPTPIELEKQTGRPFEKQTGRPFEKQTGRPFEKQTYNSNKFNNKKVYMSQTDKVGVGSCDSEKNNSLINDIIPPIKKSKRAGRIKKNNLTNSISLLFPNTTKKLREVYKEISTGTYIPRRETIDKELRRLTKRGIEKKTIIQVYKWYTSHFKEEYTPKIYKAEDLYKKFSRIEEAMNRSSQPDAALEKPTVMSYDDLDENGKWIYEKLKRASWPKGSISQLPEVIASSLQNLKEVIKINEAIIKEKTFDEALYARPDHNAHRVAWRFKKATRIGACNDFILAWFSEIYEEVSRWEQWSGKLKSYVISIDNERFQVYLKEVLQAFFGSSEQALKGWNLYVEKYRSVKEGM